MADLKDLKGLKGLSGLSQQERDAWRRLNADKLKGASSQDEDRLYRNQQFVKEFGLDAFHSYNMEQRDALYKQTLTDRAIVNNYSPYTNKKGADGNYIVDPNKGTGNGEEFQKIFAMDADSKIKLLNSGWKPSSQINKELKQKQESEQKLLNNQNTWLGAPAYAQGAALFAKLNSAPIEDTYSRTKNNNIFERIYAEDLKTKESKLQPQIDDYYLNVLSKLDDSEIDSLFMQSITPSKNNLGNSQFKAFFHEGKNVENEVKNFSIDDKRNYLAKAKVLTDNLGIGAAHDALNNYAKEYIEEHQGKLTYTGLLAKDIGISVASYTADKINSIRQLYDVTQGDSIVWIDNKGNVVAPDQVKTDKRGNKYYINDDGVATAIRQTKMSVADLDYLGKDAQGYTRDAMWNNQFWSDAEQYGTLNWDEQRQYKKLGASPYKVVYKPGDDSDLLYETTKMVSFGIADGAAAAIPWAGETLGTAMALTKGASMINKASRVIGKSLNYASKAVKGVQPTVGAAAIGHAYGRGVFGEALAQNMQQLEESTYNEARQNFLMDYKYLTSFKNQVDKEVQLEYNNLKSIQKKQLAASEGSTKIVDESLNDKVLMDKARQNVANSYINKGAQKIQNSSRYFDMVGKASESASNAAMTSAITDGLKYTIVNNFGYRKFLFNNAADRAASAIKRMAKSVSEGEGGKLIYKNLLKGKEWKTFGKILASQAWGGAWTNFTDEMQSWGGKQINQDMFSAYLDGFYNGQSIDNTYGAMDAVSSYFNGAMGSLAKGTTWSAGLVGGLGSITSFAPNLSTIASVLTTKSGRETWRNSSMGEKINMLLNNGILNEYYGKKQGEAEIKKQVEYVNRLLEEQDNFSILRRAVALDRANLDVSNQEDKDVITFLKAVQSMSLLHQFQEDNGLQEHSNSRIKRWLKKKFGGNENALNAVAQQSSILTKALSEIEDIANSNLDEETTQSLLSEYYAKNPDVAQSEESDEQALSDITNNAKALLNAEQKWQDINAKLNSVEESRGSKISSTVRGNLLERAALDDFLADKLDALEGKITGNKVNTSDESSVETWGTKKAIERQVLAMERTERTFNKTITDAKSRLDKATSKLKEFKDSHDMENLDNASITEYTQLLNDSEASKLQYEYLLNAHDKLKSRQEKMKDMSTEESSRVLSKDEILNLPSEARARMMNDENRSNYSKEQLEQIDALKNELTLREPSLLQAIQDQARLLKQKNANAKAYEMMLENPEAAYSEFEAQDDTDASIAKDLILRRISENINTALQELGPHNGVGQDAAKELIYRNLRVLNPAILDYLNETLPNEKGLEFVPFYSNEIIRAKEWSDMVKNISKAIDQMGFDDSTKKVFSDNIDNLIDRASTTEQAMGILEQVSNSTEVSNSDQANFKKLLNIINGVHEQEKSTTIETTEEKKARQESQETRAKQEEEKVQDAENKVKSHARKLYDKYLQELDEAKTPIEKLNCINKLLESDKKAFELNKERLSEEELSKIQKIQETLKKEGYEITPLLGTIYNDGMKVIAEFVDTGSKYKEGEIVSVKKPQILKDGVLAQAARITVATKVENTESNIQETYQETEKEKSNEENAQEVYNETEKEKKNQEEAERQIHTTEQTEEDVTRATALKEQQKEGVDFSTESFDLESPDWEKQVEQAQAEGHKIEETGVIPKGTADTTDQGNNEEHTSENMLGNSMYGYDVQSLENNAKEVKRTGSEPTDVMSRFFNWFDNAGIKLQEIIDNELKDIIKANSKLETLFINPLNNATDDAALKNFALLCVEYTDGVKKVHNEDNGGVVTANGKQYLIVGTLGFDRRNSAQGDTYRSVLYQGQKNRNEYFAQNSSERFYVNPSVHTEIEQMTSGRIVRERVGDTETQVRPITELISDPNRNPKGLKLQDLKWGIMFEDGLHYANVSSRNTVYPPRDTMSNLGAVFLLIEAANGNYIPAAIRPTMLSDLQDGVLKSQLNDLFNELCSVKYSERLSAINQLIKLLNLKEDGDNILIGKEGMSTVSTVKNGTVIRTFNLNDANFNRLDLINAISELNPRVNITLSTLSDPVQLKMYAEAGALSTDIAKLGTSNASYTVYATDANGNPIKTKPIENKAPNLDSNSDLEKADYKKKHSVYYKGTQYREKDGKWYDTNWKEISEPILLNQIKWASYIRANDLTPNLVSNDKYGNKGNKYYIIDSSNANAKVIKVFENGSIAELSIADSRTTINIVKEREIKAAKEKAAKEEKERLEKIENSMSPDKVEQVNEGEEVNFGESLTDEQLIAQGNGDFTSTTKPQSTDSEVKVQDNPTVNATDKESVNKGNEDINKTGNKSLTELQDNSKSRPTDITSILKNRVYSGKVRTVLKEKGFKGKPSEVEKWLKEHNMPINNITDIDAWIDMLQNCR